MKEDTVVRLPAVRLPAMKIEGKRPQKKYMVKSEGVGVPEIKPESTEVDMTKTNIREPVISEQEKREAMFNSEQLMTAEELAKFAGEYVPGGGYYQELYRHLVKVTPKGKKLKVKILDGGAIGPITDPDTGKELVAGKWQEPPKEEGAMPEIEISGGKEGEMSKGGEVKASCAEGGPVADPTAPAPEAPAEEGNGPFSSYAQTQNMDPGLIKKGNALFTNLERAIGEKDELEAERFGDEIKQFVKDLETARTDAVGKANDTALAAALKEMINDANDLLTAYQNMAAEAPSPEAEAAQETSSSVPESPPAAG